MRAQILRQENNYNVQIMAEADGKEYYTGNGKFCGTLEEAERYANRINHNYNYNDLNRAAKKVAFRNYLNEYDPYGLSDAGLCNVTAKSIVEAIIENKVMFTESGEMI